MGLSWTQAQADETLDHDVVVADALLAIYSPGLTEGPLDALTDFVFNLGIGNYRTSTLCQLVNAQNWAAAKLELLKWDHDRGIAVPGLLRRREAEAALLPRLARNCGGYWLTRDAGRCCRQCCAAAEAVENVALQFRQAGRRPRGDDIHCRVNRYIQDAGSRMRRKENSTDTLLNLDFMFDPSVTQRLLSSEVDRSDDPHLHIDIVRRGCVPASLENIAQMGAAIKQYCKMRARASHGDRCLENC